MSSHCCALILALDLDTPSLDYNTPFSAFVEKELGLEPGSLPAPSDWDFGNWPIVKGQYIELHRKAVEQGIYRHQPAQPGVAAATEVMIDHGIRIHVTTSRFVGDGQYAKVVADTAECLDEVGIRYHGINFLGDKTLFNADVLVDDAPHNIVGVSATGTTVLVWDTTYNRHLNVPGTARVHSWDEALPMILEMAEKKRSVCPEHGARAA